MEIAHLITNFFISKFSSKFKVLKIKNKASEYVR